MHIRHRTGLADSLSDVCDDLVFTLTAPAGRGQSARVREAYGGELPETVIFITQRDHAAG